MRGLLVFGYDNFLLVIEVFPALSQNVTGQGRRARPTYRRPQGLEFVQLELPKLIGRACRCTRLCGKFLG